jgi:uroporphyrinogen-III decarboxylase
MDSRELVKRTLEFDRPSRIPRQLWTLPWAEHQYPEYLAKIRQDFPDDLVHAPGFYRQHAQTHGDPYQIGTYIDEWGCIFENRQPGVIGEVKQPCIAAWEEAGKLRPPQEMLSVDVDQVNQFCRQTEKFVIAGNCPRPFERLQFLRTSENVYLDLGEQPPELFALIQQIHDFYLKEMEIWASTDVDALMFMDDWGAQRSLLISPRQWRKIFKPLYQEYVDLAHAHGKYIFMHSDGYTADILPDLAEIGLDAVNAQLFVMDIEGLGKKLRGTITFWGEIDRQHLLSFGSTEEIAQAVRRVKEALYADGGVIAQCEFGAGAKPENVYQVFKSWTEIV